MSQVDINSREYAKMTETSVTKLVLWLAIPTVISQLISSIYNTADTYFVSTLGNSATGAVGIVFSIQSLIQAFGFGMSVGCGSLLSRKLGERDVEAANRYTATGFYLSVFLGILIAVVGLSDTEGIMRLFGATDTILPYACDYGRVILAGAPIMCASFVLNFVLRSEGMPTRAMIGLSCGGIVNVILDPVLIIYCDKGITGAALATIIGQLVSFLVLLSFFLFGGSGVSIAPKYISRRFYDYYLIFKNGFPTICRQGMGSLSTTLLNIAVKPYGDAAISAISIANKVYILIRNIIIGVGQGFQPVAGYNYGAKKLERVKKSFWVATVIGTVFSVAAGIAVALFPDEVMGFFRKGDVEVIEIGRRMLLYMSMSIPVLAFSTYVNQLYQSLGFVWEATLLACCRQGIFFVPLILILPNVIELNGIQMTQAAADILTFLVSIPFLIVFLKRKLYSDRNNRKVRIK